jgi:hypothetical protein
MFGWKYVKHLRHYYWESHTFCKILSHLFKRKIQSSLSLHKYCVGSQKVELYDNRTKEWWIQTL